MTDAISSLILFCLTRWLVLTSASMPDEIVQCENSNESYRAILPRGSLTCNVKGSYNLWDSVWNDIFKSGHGILKCDAWFAYKQLNSSGYMRTHHFFLGGVGGGGAGPIVNFVSLPLSPLDHLSVRACVDIDWLGSWLRDRYYACKGSKK